MPRPGTDVVDHLLFPLVLGGACWATAAALGAGLRGELVTSAIVATVVAVAIALERLRPERPEFRRWDQPLGNEIGHFLLGTELGTVLGLGLSVLAFTRAASWLAGMAGRPLWPVGWPVPALVVLAMLLADFFGYWQHRGFHHSRRLWGFHAVHHGVERLSFVKAGRFHAVDFATATLAAYAPIVLLGAGDAMLAWVATLTGTLGVLQHANVRMRTPRWLDALVCTPAVHWQHHGRTLAASDGNFGTVVTVFDRLLGTWKPPAPREEMAIGADGVTVPRGLAAQLREPFRTATS